MVEILKRKIKAKHEIFIDEYIQIGYNSYGHLTIRYFNPANQKLLTNQVSQFTKKLQTEDEDILIVLEAEATRKLIDFLQRMGRI